MDTVHFQRIAKALADPRRFEILEVIASAGDELCCGSVVECFPVAQATVSHHLKELTGAGLIETRAEGQFKYLRARPDVLTEYINELQRRISLVSGKGSKLKSAHHQKPAKV
ncbi:MAG: ArsR family transcriptional regulator, arsenate/arsenite/antimonite-responsive transcriptional [Acidobacteriota bacterium]|jgi:ArsR family transcriptional regulator|nr:ArsR family transcriptional regulator, arsenate/arsenite/antimonite-responsive transcriptional [Acidobacteriota bacterium]